MKYWLFIFLFLFSLNPSSAESLSILSLNLHGFHPYLQGDRYLEDRSGKLTRSDSQLFYFTPNELIFGNRARTIKVVQDLESLGFPDILVFQESGTLNIDTHFKDLNIKSLCDHFYLGVNNVRLIQEELIKKFQQNYNIALTCRGNLGWQTNLGTFNDYRVFKRSEKQLSLVFNFNENPYPQGVVIEGFGVLVKKPHKIISNERLNLEVPWQNSERVVLQALVIQVLSAKGVQKKILLLNLHGSHKVRHFEQALVIQNKILSLLSAAKQEGSEFEGVFLVGDFNASLYRPNAWKDAKGLKQGDPSSIPWELKVQNEFDFDLSSDKDNLKYRLKNILINLNENLFYKAWAQIAPYSEANRRINQAIEYFSQIQSLSQQNKTSLSFTETFEENRLSGRCKYIEDVQSECHLDFPETRIDHIFYLGDLSFKNKEGSFLYPMNDWSSTEGVSDHPGIYSVFYE